MVDQLGKSHEVTIPASALNMMIEVLTQLGQGNSVSITPIHAELTMSSYNLKALPAQELEPLGLTAIHPDESLCGMFKLDSSACVRLKAKRKPQHHPPLII